jgi:nanoRNase/pAp phosphatase (c-di-AMP/oligoRNAs hydrolase)
MIALEHIASLKEYLQTAKTILVIVGPKPTDDQLAVASALTSGLVSLGKDVSLYSPKHHADRAVSNAANIATELGKQNLVVEFDYDENAVDKVSYHIGEETRKFYLTIKPKKGHKPLNAAAVNFSYIGTEADLVFLVGVHDLESLNQLYFGYETLYENAFVVTLHSFKPELGTVQFDLSGTSSLSESFVDLLEGLEIGLTEDMATDLLHGVETVTENLQSFAVTAETFEVVAKLLRAGARRIKSAVELPQEPEVSLAPVATHHSPRILAKNLKKNPAKRAASRSKTKTSKRKPAAVKRKKTAR